MCRLIFLLYFCKYYILLGAHFFLSRCFVFWFELVINATRFGAHRANGVGLLIRFGCASASAHVVHIDYYLLIDNAFRIGLYIPFDLIGILCVHDSRAMGLAFGRSPFFPMRQRIVNAMLIAKRMAINNV